MRLLVLVAAAAVAASIASAAPPFVFGQADLKLLEESNAIDRELEKRGLVFHDAAIDRHIDALGHSLVPPAGLENVRWHFFVLRDPMVNAFALPNGSVYLNSGLLARAENDDQVAGVLAHEVTHVSKRHGYLANRSLRKKNVIVFATSWASYVPIGAAAGAALQAALLAGQTAIVVSIYGYSRELERDADLSAVDHARRAGRDPAQLVRMLEIFDDKLEPEPIPIFYSDHPRTQQRVVYLKQMIGADAVSRTTGSDAGYVARLQPLLLQNVQLDIDIRRFRSALAAAGRLAAARPDDPEVLYRLGEAWRALGPRRPRLTEKELEESEQRAAYRASRKVTEEEENRKLAATREGEAALRESRAKAEDAYRRAAAVSPSSTKPYLGLGSLYQDEGRRDDAIAAYRKYLESAPDSAERDRVKRRLEALVSTGGGK